MPNPKRDEALRLADELLADIEYSKIGPSEIAKKASRLARLLDDHEAMEWLRYEVAGYTSKERGSMTPAEAVAAERSRRGTGVDEETNTRNYNVASLSFLESAVATSNVSLAGLAGGSAGGDWALVVENSRRDQRASLTRVISTNQATIDAVIGAIHEYAADRYQELRFGATAESAFETVRAEVDTNLAALVPGALPKLAAAFENANSTNPEHWANAASTCRRVLREVADNLRPPGDDVDGRKMGPEHYVNRLVAWILDQPTSRTLRDVVVSDLEYLGRRLDAFDDAGHKGAHAAVDRIEAARFLIGTYLFLGDILRLQTIAEDAESTEEKRD